MLSLDTGSVKYEYTVKLYIYGTISSKRGTYLKFGLMKWSHAANNLLSNYIDIVSIVVRVGYTYNKNREYIAILYAG